MDFNETVLFFFGVAGILIGLSLGLYLLIFKKPGLLSNKYLGGLLMILSVRTGKLVFSQFEEDSSTLFLQIIFSTGLLIGPLLMGYFSSVKKPFGKLEKYRKINLLIWVPIIVLVNISYPWDSALSFWYEYFLPFIYFQWFFYLVVCALINRRLIRKLFSSTSKLSKPETWKLNIYFGNILIWLGYRIFGYDADIVGIFTLGLLLYWGYLLLIVHRGFITNIEKQFNEKLNNAGSESLLFRLKKLMRSKKLFKDSDVSLNDIAIALKVSEEEIESLVEDDLDMTLEAYINSHRVWEAREMMRENDRLTLRQIGFACGFTSRRAFFSAFKSYTGIYPAEYKRNLTSLKI